MVRRSKNRRKKRINLPIKIVIVLVLLITGYFIYTSVLKKDLTNTSITLEQELNRDLNRNNISSSQIISRFQTEKKNKNYKWIKFTKKIRIPESKKEHILKSIRQTARFYKMKFEQEEISPKVIRVDIGKKDIILNQIEFLIGKESFIALIVDDVGYKKQIKEFIELDIPITYSILPGLPYSKFFAEKFKTSNIPYLLHMPMEPYGYPEKDPGKIALFTDMSKTEISRMIEKALKSVPGARGINNHMGSKFTSDKKSVKKMLDILKKKELFFIDSSTSKDSVGYKMAKQYNVPTQLNNMFLDNKDSYDYITDRLKKLKKTASKNNLTVVICHATRKNISKALKEYIPEIKKQGIEFVPVSQVLE
ncbi:MAG: divergent polysaccharide deacetylase family protein [Elusimicrobiota bacterium]